MPGPADELWIRDPEALRVFSEPMRLKILQLLQTPASVKEVAGTLGLPAPKLHYHVKRLLDQQLIRVVEERREGHLVEKLYQVSARRFRLANPLAGDALPDEDTAALFSGMIEDSRESLLRSLQDSASGEAERPVFTRKRLRLTEVALHRLRTELLELITRLNREDYRREDEDSLSCDFTLILNQTREAE